MTEAALILPTDVTRDGADWRCSQCGELTEAGQLNRRETEIATAMAGLLYLVCVYLNIVFTNRPGQLQSGSV